MLHGLNHITITVSDIDRSLAFYCDVLGFTPHVKWLKGAYLSVGDLWFCLALGRPSQREDYTHIALSISHHDYATFIERLTASHCSTWKENSSEGLSYYLLDPDGHQLEIHVGDLKSRLASLEVEPYEGLVWL